MLPTWTGCVALLVSLRKKEQSLHRPRQAERVQVIDVGSDS